MEYQQDSTSFLIPSNKPQLHSRKCHHTYNATRSLPVAIWIRSLRFGLDLSSSNSNHSSSASDYGSDDDEDDQAILGKTGLFSSSCTVLYEIVLYYDHNRACTIYRTPEDFAKLKEAVGPAKYRKWVQNNQQQQQQQLLLLKHHSRHAPSDSEDEEEFRFGLAPTTPVVEDVDDLQRFLSKTISSKGRNCPALEYFLRRRMDDCGGM